MSTGNIVLTPEVFNLFLIYLAGFIGVAAYMFMKVELFSFGIWMVGNIFFDTVSPLI